MDMLHVPSSSDHVYCNGGSAVLQSWECSNLVQNLQNISPQWSRGHCASETCAATVVLIVQFPRCSDSPNMGWHILTTQSQWWRHLLPITTHRNYNLLNKRDIYPGEILWIWTKHTTQKLYCWRNGKKLQHQCKMHLCVTKGAVPNCCLGIVWDFWDLWPSTASSQLHPVTPTHSPLVIQIRFWSSSDHEQKLNIPPKLWLTICEITKKVLVKVWKSRKYLENIA